MVATSVLLGLVNVTILLSIVVTVGMRFVGLSALVCHDQ